MIPLFWIWTLKSEKPPPLFAHIIIPREPGLLLELLLSPSNHRTHVTKVTSLILDIPFPLHNELDIEAPALYYINSVFMILECFKPTTFEKFNPDLLCFLTSSLEARRYVGSARSDWSSCGICDSRGLPHSLQLILTVYQRPS
jgi:hypothetical protein